MAELLFGVQIETRKNHELLTPLQSLTSVQWLNVRTPLVRTLFKAGGFRVERSGRYGALPRHQIAAVLPRWLCDSEEFSYFYDAADWIGAALLPWFVQNHYVVARSLTKGDPLRQLAGDS
jgi:hypothetical protein